MARAHRASTAGKDERHLKRQFERFQRRLPGPVGRGLHWIRQPAASWLRIPVGVLLILGGLCWFLPIVGLWMLPLGLLLLAQDLPFLRRPMRRLLVRAERRWNRWRRERRRAA